MLRISELSLARGLKLLLEDASLTVHPGHKVGLIGANGSGKTSLFALIRGELSQDKGEWSIPPGWVIAHVAQEAAPSATSAIDYVLDGDKELRTIERALAVAQADEEADAHAGGEHIAELHHRFEIIDGYSARARAAALLSGLGFQRRAARRSGVDVLRRLAHASQSGAGAHVPLGPARCSTNPPTTSTSMPCCGWKTGWSAIPERCC